MAGSVGIRVLVVSFTLVDMTRDVESEVEHQAVDLLRRHGRAKLTTIAGYRVRMWVDAARRARDAGRSDEYPGRKAHAWSRVQAGRSPLRGDDS